MSQCAHAERAEGTQRNTALDPWELVTTGCVGGGWRADLRRLPGPARAHVTVSAFLLCVLSRESIGPTALRHRRARRAQNPLPLRANTRERTSCPNASRRARGGDAEVQLSSMLGRDNRAEDCRWRANSRPAPRASLDPGSRLCSSASSAREHWDSCPMTSRRRSRLSTAACYSCRIHGRSGASVRRRGSVSHQYCRGSGFFSGHIISSVSASKSQPSFIT